jgi:phosphate transport system substrate-binding protein
MLSRRTLVAVVLLAGCGKTPPADTAGRTPLPPLETAELNAQGATFVEPVMKEWANEFLALSDGKVKVNYQGTGSGAGVTQMTKKLAAFGCSDAPMNKKQLDEARATGGDVIHVPLVIGAVVPAYNLPGVDQTVTFTGPLLAEVFTGKVKKWNDPKLKALNPGLALPDLDLQPVYRSDPSGTSFIFADYLAKVDDGFRKTVGASTTPKWPETVGIRQPKSDGVAGYIDRTPGAIGYVELTYALDKKAKYGAVRNRAGTDVRADLDGITAAAAASLDQPQAHEPYSLHELTYNLTDAPGEKSYPIAGMSFAVLYRTQEGAAGKAVVAFLRWATGPEGQELAKARNYAPLPASLREKVHARLDTVEVR